MEYISCCFIGEVIHHLVDSGAAWIYSLEEFSATVYVAARMSGKIMVNHMCTYDIATGLKLF